MRIGLLHANPLFPFIFEAAEEYGFELVLFARADQVPERFPKATIACVALDLTNERAALETVSMYAKDYRLQGLLTLWEGAVPFTARAAAHLGLPGLAPQAADATRDKGLMRTLLQHAGLNTPGFVRLTDPSELSRCRQLRYPIVVKPARGYGSLGVVRVDSPKDLESALFRVHRLCRDRLASFGLERAILVEEFVSGPEFIVDAMASPDGLALATIAYKGAPRGPYFEEEFYFTPADVESGLRAAIEEQVALAVRALGITLGATHTEVRLREGTEPVVLDLAARLGGAGCSAPPVRTAHGIDLLQTTLADSLSLSHLAPEAPDQSSIGSWVTVAVGAGGMFQGFVGLAPALEHPSTQRFVRLSPSGTIFRAYPDFCGFPGIFFGQHRDHEEAKAYASFVRRTVGVQYASSTQEPTETRG